MTRRRGLSNTDRFVPLLFSPRVLGDVNFEPKRHGADEITDTFALQPRSPVVSRPATEMKDRSKRNFLWFV